MRQSDVVATTVVRSPLSVRGLRDRLVEHVRVPLHRDGYALALNSAFTAATGLLYWIFAAKTYSTHAVGLNSALISSMMFLAGIASLNLPNIVVRFLPQSGNRTRIRVICAYGVSGALALGAAAVFIIGTGAWAPRLGFLRTNHGLQAWFLCSTLAWCLFVIQDSVLTALGRAVWVPVENAVFSVLKLGLLALLAAMLPVYGIFVSWTLAMLVSVIGVNAVIFARLMRPVSRRASGPSISVRDRAFARYFTTDYACSIASLATPNLIPLIVTAVAGATTNAYWAMPYAVTMPLYLFGQNIGTSLMLHGSTDRRALKALTRKAAIQGARVLVPLAILLMVLAPYLLALFGDGYADNGTTLLRLLVLGSVPNLILSLAVSVSRVQRRLGRALAALGTEAVVTLASAAPLIHALGVTGAGVAWVGAECVVATGLLLTWRTSLDAESSDLPQAPNGGSLAAGERHDMRAALRTDEPTPAAVALHPVLRRLFETLERRGVCWTLLRIPSNPAAPSGDVDILVAPGDADALRCAAAELGFIAVPGWGRPPNLILVCYHRPSDRWLVLDVSTAVSFRSPPSWRLAGAAEQVLRHRRLRDGMVVPADGDAFWLLLLHCLLDKHRVVGHHQARLRDLASTSTALTSPLGTAVCSAAGDRFAPVAFVRAAALGDWNALSEMGASLIAQLRRRRSIGERLRVLGGRLSRLIRKPLLLRRRKGISVALLGPNGVGKSTAAAGLHRAFPLESRVVYMGVWKAANRPRTLAMTVIEILARPLQIWRRYLLAEYHRLRGRLVVFDRYVYEALLPPRPPLVRCKRAYFWLLAHLIPKPYAAVVLDVPGHVAYGRKQENPAEVLESERRIYARLSSSGRSLEVIDAEVDADTVRAEITTIIWRELASRWQAGRKSS
jgi:O-antigen/teichoic acid export membrane protein/thymidylate kinase